MKALVCRCHNGHMIIASQPGEALGSVTRDLVRNGLLNPFCAICGSDEWAIEEEELDSLEAEESRQQEERDSATEPFDSNPIDLKAKRKEIFGG